MGSASLGLHQSDGIRKAGSASKWWDPHRRVRIKMTESAKLDPHQNVGIRKAGSSSKWPNPQSWVRIKVMGSSSLGPHQSDGICKAGSALKWWDLQRWVRIKVMGLQSWIHIDMKRSATQDLNYEENLLLFHIFWLTAVLSILDVFSIFKYCTRR